MTERSQGEFVSRFFDWWMPITARMSGWIVAVTMLLAVLSVVYTVNHLAIDTDTGGMISRDLPFKRAYANYQKEFPQGVDTLLVVVDAATEESADRAASLITDFVHGHDDLFLDVYEPGSGDFFRKNQLLYASLTDLEKLSDRLASAQPFIAILSQQPNVTGLTELLRGAVDRHDPAAIERVKPIVRGFDDTMESILKNQDSRLSWVRLMRGESADASPPQRMIIIRPRMNYNEITPAAAAMKAIRNMARENQLDRAHGYRVRMTGEVALAADELNTISTGATRAMVLAFIMVGLALWKALGSPRLVIASVITLITGIIFTTTFAAVAVGRLNMISMAFAVLYIGLSVDYSIHFCLRYRELRRRRHAHLLALRSSGVDIGPSLILCAVSTAIGFYAFIPTSFVGISELGIIAGTGMFISLILNLVFLPALLTVIKSPQKKSSRFEPVRTHPIADPIIHFMTHRRGTIRLTALGLTLLAIFYLPRMSFDADPINLRDPHSESVATLNDLMNSGELQPWTASILSPDGNGAKRIAVEMEGLASVDKTVDIFSFVAKRQEDKMALIDDLDLIIGPIPEMVSENTGPTVEEQMKALREYEKLLLNIHEAEGDAPVGNESGQSDSTWELSGESVQRFLQRLQGESDEGRVLLLKKLNDTLFADFPIMLDTLRDMMQASPFTVGDLPANVRERWISASGLYRVEIIPREDLRKTAELRRFVTQVRSVNPGVTGSAVSIMESGNIVVASFQEAIGGALVAISVVLLIVLRDIKKTILILIPLVSAGLMTGAATVIFDLPFNFANVMALPLLLGVGVDNGIHIVQRARGHSSTTTVLFHTSTARAIFYSALTTILSFGNLAFMSHRGISSMGIILSIGVLLTLYSTLLVLPAIMSEPHIRDVPANE